MFKPGFIIFGLTLKITSMKFNILLVTAFIAIAPCLSAQTRTQKVTVTDGPENDTKRSFVLGLFGADDNGYYTLRHEKKSLLVEHLSRGMAVDKSVKMENLLSGKMGLEFNSALQMEDHFYFLYTAHDQKTEQVYFYAKRMNPKTLLTEGELIQLGKEQFVSDRKFMRSSYFFMWNPFSTLVSDDQSHFCVISNTMDEEKDGDLKRKLAVYTSALEKEWDAEVNAGFKSDMFSITNITLDDNGDVSIVGVEYKEKLTAKQLRRSGKPNYTHHLIRYTEKGTASMSMPVELNGKFITDLRIQTAETGAVIVAGFYSEKGSFSVKGAFYLNIDPATESIQSQKFSEFGTEFITQNLTDREERKAKNKEAKGEALEMNEFDMRSLVLRGDGGATLIAEQYIFYVTSHTVRNANGTSSTTYTYHYHYNDIIVVSFNNAGELLWKTKIAKRQYTTNDGGQWSSYAMAIMGDKLYFIFNDNPKNLFIGADETPYNFSAARELAVVLVEVDSNGKAAKELLFSSDRNDVKVQPKIAKQTGEREVVICSQRSKIFQYSKLTFK